VLSSASKALTKPWEWLADDDGSDQQVLVLAFFRSPHELNNFPKATRL
jgi:hypothetical protein